MSWATATPASTCRTRRPDDTCKRPAASPKDPLGHEAVNVAQRIALIPPDIAQLNKRVVHRGMEIMGLRSAIRAGTELCALGTKQETMYKFIAEMRGGLTKALQHRDEPFGDYRTAEPHEG